MKQQQEKTAYAKGMNLVTMRDQLKRMSAEEDGRYWKSLNQHLASNPNPEGHKNEAMDSGVDRREFMKLAGASLSMAGLAACTRQPKELIVPYVDAPEEIIPGKPLFYATAAMVGGYAYGVLAESHMGRPTKLEGNEKHPASLGAADAIIQGTIRDLYDPERSKVLIHKGRPSNWAAFKTFWEDKSALYAVNQGEGIRLLMASTTSPSINAKVKAFKERFPKATVHYHNPLACAQAFEANKSAFGEQVDSVFSFDKAKIVLSLGSNFLGEGPARTRYAKEFADRRDLTGGNRDISRLYVAETNYSITGGMADHRLALSPIELESFARYVAKGVGITVSVENVQLEEKHQKIADALIKDLHENKGAVAIVPGERSTVVTQVLAHAMNEALGAIGQTVTYGKALLPSESTQTDSMALLVKEMNAGTVDCLIMLGCNPVYNTNVGERFASSLSNVATTIHLGQTNDETGRLCAWHIPQSHYLESWADGIAYDGTVSIAQPLIEPLFNSKSSLELLTYLSGEELSGHDVLKAYWKDQKGELGFESFWRKSLHDGIVHNENKFSPINAKINRSRLEEPFKSLGVDDLEINIEPDVFLLDGVSANNAWLQELPRPISTLTWDNAILMHPATAEKYGVKVGERDTVRPTNDVVRIQVNNTEVQGPVLPLPGHAKHAVTVVTGYGRTYAGEVGSNVGFNAFPLIAENGEWRGVISDLKKTGKSHLLALTQDHHSMEGRALVRSATLDQFKHDPEFAPHMSHEFPPEMSLYEDSTKNDHLQSDTQWGMTIDLNRCTSCNACVLACNAENNTPVVGKKEILNGREMHWIRLDRYFEGDAYNSDEVSVHTMPVACVHCELAPCETVCPAGATVHSDDGLNQMVYNRCIGTRYCSNNCPYKVRRFNFFQYANADDMSDPFNLLQNPDVTIRSRGVMEKCTYCVQRISKARIEAKKENRPIADGEVVTACQQACPTKAIEFGNIRDPQSRVSQKRNEPLSYRLLAEVNTRPRTSHLARVRNPNTDLVPYTPLKGGGHHGKYDAKKGGSSSKAKHAKNDTTANDGGYH